MSTTHTLSGSVVGLVGEPMRGSYSSLSIRGRVEAWGKAHVGTDDAEAGQIRLGTWPITINAVSGAWSVSGLPATGDDEGWAPSYQAHRVVFEWTDPGTGTERSWASEWFPLTANTSMDDVATWVETQIHDAAYWAGVAQEAAENIGSPNSLEIGTVTDGPDADATITGEAPNQILNLVLPKGDEGDVGPAGPANSLSIGTVADGDEADATITGTAPAQVLNLVLPKGEKGDPGEEGPEGPPGEGSVSTVNGDAGPDVVLDHTDVGAASAAQGGLADTAVQPGDLATVATSGDYDDLTDKPTLGSAAPMDATDFALSTGGGREKIGAFSGTSGTITANLNNGSVFAVSPTGNITLAFSNVPTSPYAVTVTVHVLQGGTPRTVTMPGGTTWYQPGAPTQVANKACTITLHTANGGSNWYAAAAVMS